MSSRYEKYLFHLLLFFSTLFLTGLFFTVYFLFIEPSPLYAALGAGMAAGLVGDTYIFMEERRSWRSATH
ncbi:MAG: hypothetical protein J7L88_02880 [Thermoplasmata archaeon]|nr:hypothetical protein [Thermoplasmata archaeon]